MPAFVPLTSLSALVEASVERRGRRRSFQAALLVKGPNLLRISLLDDLGQEIATLVADGNQVLWWDRERNDMEVFPQDGEELKKTLRLPLGVHEFVKILLEGPKARPNDATYELTTQNFQDDPVYPRNWLWQFRKPRADLEIDFVDLVANPDLTPERFDTGHVNKDLTFQ